MPVLTKINTNVIADDAVTAAKIPAGAVAADIGVDGITANEIAADPYFQDLQGKFDQNKFQSFLRNNNINESYFFEYAKKEKSKQDKEIDKQLEEISKTLNDALVEDWDKLNLESKAIKNLTNKQKKLNVLNKQSIQEILLPGEEITGKNPLQEYLKDLLLIWLLILLTLWYFIQ